MKHFRLRIVFASIFCAITPLSIAQSAKDEVSVALPGKTWSVQTGGAGFTVQQNVTKPDGRKYFEAANNATGMVLSVTLEEVGGPANMGDCRRALSAKPEGPFKVTDRKESDLGELPTVEYIIPEINGIPLQQKNLFTCLVKENVYIDVHVSKAPFKPADQPLLVAVLQSIHFANVSEGDSKDYVGEGNKYFAAGQYDKAIIPYQKAFDLEKASRTLDDLLWKVLLDNLAMSYGIIGKLTAAEEVLQYGITRDAKYPLFYYILANVYAGRNDRENTMKYLRLALERKQNVLPGERMPDPRKDESFERFLKNDAFRQLMNEF